MARDLIAGKEGIKSEILNLLGNAELRTKLEKNINIERLYRLIDEYLHYFLDKIKKEKIEHFFRRYYYEREGKIENFKEINENFYYKFNYYNKNRNSGSRRAIRKRLNGINPVYLSILRIILDVIFSLQEKSKLAEGEPIYRNLSKLLNVCNEILSYYLKENTRFNRKIMLKAFFFCNNVMPQESKEKEHKILQEFFKKRIDINNPDFQNITGIILEYDDVCLIKDLVKITNRIGGKMENLNGKKLPKHLISNINNYLLEINSMFSLGIKNQIDENEIINAVTAGFKDIFLEK